MYIAIEGLKGTGKSTLMQTLLPLLQEQLAACDIQTLSPTTPIPDHPLEAHFFARQDDDNYLQELYAKRSNHHASNIDWNADLIISDRSLFTSLAVRWHHAENKRLSALQHYQQIRVLESVIPLPDITIQLDAPDDILMSRYKTRTRIYGKQEETLAAISTLRRNYKQMYAWLASHQAQTVTDKPIELYQYDTAYHTPEQTCDHILNDIGQHLSHIVSEKAHKNSYSLSA